MTVWLEIGGKERRVELPAEALSAGGAVECVVDGRVVAVDFAMLQPGVMSLCFGMERMRAAVPVCAGWGCGGDWGRAA